MERKDIWKADDDRLKKGGGFVLAFGVWWKGRQLWQEEEDYCRSGHVMK